LYSELALVVVDAFLVEGAADSVDGGDVNVRQIDARREPRRRAVIEAPPTP
jgi:hypothetical protein